MWEWDVGVMLQTHGGVQGVTTATESRPWLTRLITKALQHTAPGEAFTSVMLLIDVESLVHRDK